MKLVQQDQFPGPVEGPDMAVGVGGIQAGHVVDRAVGIGGGLLSVRVQAQAHRIEELGIAQQQLASRLFRLLRAWVV